MRHRLGWVIGMAGVLVAGGVPAAPVHLQLVDEFAREVAVEIRARSGGPATITDMTSPVHGRWAAALDLPPGEYAYRFRLDGQEVISDFSQPAVERGDEGSVWSSFTLGDDGFANFKRPSLKTDLGPTFPVTLRFRQEDAGSVAVAGEFNQWALTPLRRQAGGRWRVDLSLPAGSYGYKFVVDGRWLLDPEAKETTRVNNTENSRLVVTVDQAAEPPDDVPPADPAAGTVDVTFSYYDPLVSRVALVGTFNQWNGDAYPLAQRDGVWTCVIPLAPGTYEYKFKADETWVPDPNNPHQADPATGGNSILVVEPIAPVSELAGPLFAKDCADPGPVLLESAAPWHPLAQELVRAYVYILATDGQHWKVADGSLLEHGHVPIQGPTLWSWSLRADAGTPQATLTVSNRSLILPMAHPVLGPPQDWLADLRRQAGRIWAEPGLAFTGPTSPAPGSAWAEALARRDECGMLSDVWAVNELSRFGRSNGWSRALLRDLAVTCAEMADDVRYPSLGGRMPQVLAARAVVYADLARGNDVQDEIMAYVLCRIGRVQDGGAFLPDQPVTFYGQLAAAMAAADVEPLLAWAGSPDFHGFARVAGQASRNPKWKDMTLRQRALVLRTLSDLLWMDNQRNLARMYLDAAVSHQPGDFSLRAQALDRGGVSAGHQHTRVLLQLAAQPELWRQAAGRGRPVVEEEVAPFLAWSERGATEQEVSEVVELHQASQRKFLDVDSEALPAAVRLYLVRDLLNLAWWHSANFYGRQLYAADPCRDLNRLMNPWKLLQPEMEAFTRFLMTGPQNDRGYNAIRHGLLNSQRAPDTLAYIQLVKKSFRTWLFDRAQSFYPRAPFLVSDVLEDYQAAESIYVFKDMDYQRAHYRRLAPHAGLGYPGPGGESSVPEALRARSLAVNQRLAEANNLHWEAESQAAALTYFRRCLELGPYETDLYQRLAEVLLDQGQYAEVVQLIQAFPDATEGLDEAAIHRLGACAAYAMGDVTNALHLARSAAASGQAWSMLMYAHLLEMAGRSDESLKLWQGEGERYGDPGTLFYLVRHRPGQSVPEVEQSLRWLEQFPDLDAASQANQFSFNEFKPHPFYYVALGRWDRALWLLKPLAEAVQNDYIWFLLLTVGQHEQDQAAIGLAQHVLANHVQNVFGEYARFMRGQRAWSEVLNAARLEGKPQPVYVLAAITAEQRGDSALARRLYQHAMAPRFGLEGWYTMAWNGLKALGGDPEAVARRPLNPSTGTP